MKTYEKPMLYAESFELVEHIAACSDIYFDKMTHRGFDKGCAFAPNGIVDGPMDLVFLSDNSKCNIVAPNTDDNPTCYQGTFVEDGSVVFAS